MADTFKLALGGPAALVATLGTTSVTLAAGAYQEVPITTIAASFAEAGDLPLVVSATSQTNAAVQAGASAELTIDCQRGLSVTANPASVTLPEPGPASFVVSPQNTGNPEDAYEATIIGTTGPVSASLTGLDGLPTQSVPPSSAAGALHGRADARHGVVCRPASAR